MMERNECFLNKAEALKPELHTRTLAALGGKQPLKKGESVCLDFGEHVVGTVTVRLGFSGSHPDAPAWIRLQFAEQPIELFERAEDYRGWISTGWKTAGMY